MTEIERQEVNTIKQLASETSDTIKTLNSKTDRIYYALVGNDLTRDGGIVQQIKDMEERQEKFEVAIKKELELQKKQLDELSKTIGKWKGIAIGMLLCGSIIGYLIKYIIDHHFKN